ncbi:hypothetical protein DOY81_010942 [Sarcophaga bullata]|nr:hypothetical protein DOY81_010942 [Sarcophaga bullata]
MSQLSSSTNTHIFRSLSSESQKKDWSKRLSLRGIRHHGTSGSSPSASAKDDVKKHKFFNRSSSLKTSTNITTLPSLDLGVGGHTSSTQASFLLNSQQQQQQQQQHFNAKEIKLGSYRTFQYKCQGW